MPFEKIFAAVARQYGLDPAILAEQAARESRLDPAAVGSAQDMGLMQILPSTWSEWAPKVGATDPYDPESNVRVAGAYLAWIREQLSQVGRHEPYWMLTAYNWGIGNVLRLLRSGGTWSGVPPVRQEYATEIMLNAEARVMADQPASPS